VHRIHAESANDLAVRWNCKAGKCGGPRFLLYAAALEMHPLDTEDRQQELKSIDGIGLCNITKCCTVACPEEIKITDHAIIPLKEHVVDRFYDPLRGLFRVLKGKQA